MDQNWLSSDMEERLQLLLDTYYNTCDTSKPMPPHYFVYRQGSNERICIPASEYELRPWAYRLA